MRGFLQRHRFLLLGVAFLFFLGFIAIVLSGGKNNQIPVSTPNAGLWNFDPGVTTKDQVVNSLGSPITEIKQNNQVIDSFKSKSETRDHEVVFQNNTSEFFKQIVAYGETIKITDLTQKYGSTNNILYGKDSGAGYYLYAYPEKGIAFVGNQNTADVLEIWYFKPTNLDNFKKLWASDYSTTLNISQ